LSFIRGREFSRVSYRCDEEEEEEEEEKTREYKKSVRCCCSPALSARSWIFGCPSFFFFSDGRREKDEMMFFVSLMRRVKETVVKREFVTNNSLSFSSRKNVFVVVY
jgi:hypothetical protein